MDPDDHDALIHPEDALEAKLRLGVLMSSILEGAQILCTDVALLKQEASGRVLRSYAADFISLAAAIEVLDRRSASSFSRS